MTKPFCTLFVTEGGERRARGMPFSAPFRIGSNARLCPNGLLIASAKDVHAEIRRFEADGSLVGLIVEEDLRCNGRLLRKGCAEALEDGDVIVLGDAKIIYKSGEVDVNTWPEPPTPAVDPETVLVDPEMVLHETAAASRAETVRVKPPAAPNYQPRRRFQDTAFILGYYFRKWTKPFTAVAKWWHDEHPKARSFRHLLWYIFVAGLVLATIAWFTFLFGMIYFPKQTGNSAQPEPAPKPVVAAPKPIAVPQPQPAPKPVVTNAVSAEQVINDKMAACKAQGCDHVSTDDDDDTWDCTVKTPNVSTANIQAALNTMDKSNTFDACLLCLAGACVHK